MSSIFTAGGLMWGSMDLIREKDRPDYEPREIMLLSVSSRTWASD